LGSTWHEEEEGGCDRVCTGFLKKKGEKKLNNFLYLALEGGHVKKMRQRV